MDCSLLYVIFDEVIDCYLCPEKDEECSANSRIASCIIPSMDEHELNSEHWSTDEEVCGERISSSN